MKTFKIADTWISITLIISVAIMFLIRFSNTLLLGYIVVGIWQIISMITHTVNGWFIERNSKRYWYHWIVAITIMVVLSGFVIQPMLIVLLYLLLFVSPFMAVYYTWLCYDEVRKMNQRPLARLK